MENKEDSIKKQQVIDALPTKISPNVYVAEKTIYNSLKAESNEFVNGEEDEITPNASSFTTGSISPTIPPRRYELGLESGLEYIDYSLTVTTYAFACQAPRDEPKRKIANCDPYHAETTKIMIRKRLNNPRKPHGAVLSAIMGGGKGESVVMNTSIVRDGNGWHWKFKNNKTDTTILIRNSFQKEVEKIATSFYVTNFPNYVDAKRLWKACESLIHPNTVSKQRRGQPRGYNLWKKGIDCPVVVIVCRESNSHTINERYISTVFVVSHEKESLAESTEGAPQFSPERPRVYSDLSPEEKDRNNADNRATNILLQGLPKDIYTLINHYTDAKDIWDNHKGDSIHDYYDRFAKLINDMRNIKMTMSRMQLNSKFVNNMLPEWGRFVTDVKLNRGLRDSNYNQLYAYLKQHETHAKENKMILEQFSQNTVDPLALTSNVSNPQLYSPSSSTSSSTQVPQPIADNPHLDSSLSPVENLIENLTNTLALLTQSYKTFLPQTNNQLRTSSNARNQATVQEDRVVVQNVQGRQNRGHGMNPRGGSAVEYGGAQNRVGNVNPGQARPVKCYNCNGTGHIAQENEVSLDAEQLLFLAGGQDTAFDDDVAPTAQTMFMANLSSADPATDEAEPSYDSNILSDVHDHDHYQDAACARHEEHVMHESVQLDHVVDSHADYTSDSNMIPYDQYVKDNEVPVVHSDVSSAPNDAFMMIYNDMCEPHAQSVCNTSRNTVVKNSQTAELSHIRNKLNYNHALAIVHNTEDTLEMAEITRKKINAKMNDPECVTRKVKIAPHDYSKENFLATFTPQKQLTLEQIFWSNDLIKLKSKALKEQTTVSRLIKALTVYPPNTPATLVPKVLPTEKSKVFSVATNSELNVARFTEMTVAHTDVEARCLELEAQTLEKVNSVSKDQVKPKVLARGKHAIDVEPIVPRLRNNRDAHLDYLRHLKESVETIRDIIEEAWVNQVTVSKPSDKSDSNTHIHVETVKPQKTNVPVPPSTGVNSCPNASGSQPKSNVKPNRISPAKGVNMLPVEDQPMTNKSQLRTLNRVDSSSRLKCTVIQIVLWYLDSGCSKHMTGDRSRLMNFIIKSSSKQLDSGMTTLVLSWVMEIMQFCDSDLEVAFRKHSCYVRDTDGVELIKGAHVSNLYTVSIEDMMKSYPIYLLSKASKNKS
uniref:Integrase, catalytic region, zinc finger, CCHC-type, peptidase aspartic, catalytic n=1 Tax=Tanacetum cinerariifolium TaxID=118510 RepID=A0A6L2J8G4_TANCI|nr:integrase, catalytic region, zinc finger, CCHC-type, peptidase aspartic, catalytic [Tanacetum cinerariifolium]